MFFNQYVTRLNRNGHAGSPISRSLVKCGFHDYPGLLSEIACRGRAYMRPVRGSDEPHAVVALTDIQIRGVVCSRNRAQVSLQLSKPSPASIASDEVTAC